MKRLLTVLLFTVSFATAFAGGFDPYKVNPDFEKAIKPVLASLDSSGPEGYATLVETFKGLADKYPREWRSYYWQAFANIRKAEMTEGEEKEASLAEAERLINRAEMFVKENTELYLLRAWMLHEKIAADPSVRQVKYGTDEKWYLDQVYMKDQSNPRYFFLKGKWSEIDTTEKGKKETLRYYESANILFNERPRSRFYAEPDWGRGETLLALGIIQPMMAAEEQMAAEGAGNEAAPGEEIPDEMRGAVLPESLTDDEAGEIKIDSASTGGNAKKDEFKLFNFKKSSSSAPAVEEAPAEEETPAATAVPDTKKKGKNKPADKKDKSKKKVKSPEKKSKKGKDKKSRDIQPTDIEVATDGSAATEEVIVPAEDNKDAKKAKEKKAKGKSTKTKAKEKSKKSKKK
jgi:hypothetical protein